MRSLGITWSCLALSFGLVGCAGPTTPFGGLNGIASLTKKVMTKLKLGRPTATVRLTPKRQLLHDKTEFEIYIDDLQGIPEDFILAVHYNGFDLTSSFLRNAEQTWLDPDHRHVRFTTRYLRLPLERDHVIQVIYKRNAKTDAVVADFHPPRCDIFASGRKVASIPRFDPPPEVIQNINRFARARQLNPHLVAALIAQESSFESTAVSPSKAIGLTQITSLGEAEVAKNFATWPRYPAIEDMSVLQLKLGILNGQINPANEWRLDPVRSIQGGTVYLSYLNDYWTKPEKQSLVKKRLGDSDENIGPLLLASYNSGPARVTRAIERGGKDWLFEQELTEARKYVRRVTSYCDHFSNGEQ